MLLLPVAVAIPGLLATFIYLRVPGHRFYRSVYFFPAVLSPVIVGAIFNLLLAFDGPLNTVLGAVGVGPVDWLGDPGIAMFTVVGVHIWATFGMALVVFLAGFATLDAALLDAARVDGASLRQIIWHVIIPGLSRTIQFVFVTTMIGMLTSMFGLLYVMTSGGPEGSTYLPEYYIWIQQGQMNRPALASAASTVLFLIMLVVGLAADRAAAARGEGGLMRGSRLAGGWSRSRWPLLALATIYPLVFTANVAMKTRRDYILDRFSLAGSLRWDNIADGVDQRRHGPVLRQLAHRGGRRRRSAAAARLDGRLRAEPTAVPRLIGAVPGLPRGAVHPVPGDHGAARADHGRQRARRHLSGADPGLRRAVPAVHDLPDDQLLQDHPGGDRRRGPDRREHACTASTGGSCCRSGAPALLSVGILNALFCWNDVLIALLMMPSAEHRTLMVGVTSLRGQYSDDIPTFASGVLIAAVPVLVVYLFFQRQIADGVTAGSTKG